MNNYDVVLLDAVVDVVVLELNSANTIVDRNLGGVNCGYASQRVGVNVSSGDLAILSDELDGISLITIVGAVLLEYRTCGRCCRAYIVNRYIDGSLSLVLLVVELDLVVVAVLQVAGGDVVNGGLAGSVNAEYDVLGVQLAVSAVLVVLVENGNFLADEVVVHLVGSLSGVTLVVGGAGNLNLAVLQGRLNVSVALKGTGELFQTHVLLANGRVLGVVGAVLGVLAIAKNYSVSEDCVVHQLSCVLTRARTGKGSVNVLQKTVLVSQSVGLGSPGRAYQTSLGSVVAEGYEQHLSSFLSGNGLVRCKLGCRLTSDDAQGLAVLDVASSPVAVDVSESGLFVVVSRCIGLTSAQNVNHLCHFCTSYGIVRLERAVGVTIDYAEGYQGVHDFSVDLDVGLIRERRTGKHSERASERQYQCENLFEIAGKIIDFS